MTEVNPRIRIKRGFGPPIENNEILLSRGELAFDEFFNKLYIGKGTDPTPVSNNPTQAEEIVIINSLKHSTSTFYNLNSNPINIITLSTPDSFFVEKIDIHIMIGSCDVEIKYGNISTDDVSVGQFFLQENDLESLVVQSFVPENQIVYAIITNASVDSSGLTIQHTYR
jgi:hypothetical protein